MAQLNHTYGPTCHLSHTVTTSGSKANDDIPALKAQFFYSSPLPIDDPLTPVPANNVTDSKTAKHNPRPFSAYDNNALEEAWLGLTSCEDKKKHRKLGDTHKLSIEAQASKRESIVCELAIKHYKKHAKEAFLGDSTAANHRKLKAEASAKKENVDCETCPPESASRSADQKTRNSDIAGHAEETLTNSFDPHCEDRLHARVEPTVPICCDELENDCKAAYRKAFGSALPKRESKTDYDKFLNEVIEQARLLKESNITFVGKSTEKEPKKLEKRSGQAVTQSDTANDQPLNETGNDGAHSKLHSLASPPTIEKSLKEIIAKEHQSKAQKTSENSQHSKDHQAFEKYLAVKTTVEGSSSNPICAPGNPEIGTTGSPFMRVPERDQTTGSGSGPNTPTSTIQDDLGDDSAPDNYSGNYLSGTNGPKSDLVNSLHDHKCKAHKGKAPTADVPVGISRLHLVKLPALQMMPIYWSPVHDIAAVTRATWFYKDNMYPVESPVANQLERGYQELRPWSQTWIDELNSAIEVGAAGEEKISFRLWPKEIDQQVGGRKKHQTSFMPTDPFCVARCFGGAAAATGTVDPDHPDEKTSDTVVTSKRYLNSHIIYKDSQNAFILKPSLLPSEYYGRKPVGKIKRGTTVGLHVVRGFNWEKWDKLHPSKKSPSARKAEEVVSVTGNADAGHRTACPACQEQEERPRVTDLVLVIHGIGQKLSERVESFHFTHAINDFRRSVNVELGNEAVRKVLRSDLGGIMVLPVNWRSNLSLDSTVSDFTLKDITPETIPAVRSVISEVVMDVPYYMSGHRSKMNEALTMEANRVYRLWCKNNPAFHKDGRVHIIAHSLGSAMAMDVLSKQPTSAERFDLNSKKVPAKRFEFDTKNLFFAGSPAGLFLLLDKARLMPRKGRDKPGADHEYDNGKDVTGEVGTFGCLAIDNLYNIIHQNDPIACRLNATVDSLYASSLKNAHVPSTTTGWLGTIGNAMRAITPGTPTIPDLDVGELPKPIAVRQPSQLEMEVHDFTREEIAEKKFYLLNDNGQIDYFLSSGGGPLEIQYLNMLSAHSSYWVSPDFVRMLVLEVGRKPGRLNTLPNMRVTKKTAPK